MKQTPTLAQLFGRTRVSTAVAVVGGIAVVVGSVGPWLATSFGSVSGVHGTSDGWITLGCGVVAVSMLAAGDGRPWASVLAFVGFAGALGVAGYDGARIIKATSKLTLFGVHVAGAGWGIYAVAVGGAVGCLGVAMDAVVVRERDQQGNVRTFTDLRVATTLLTVIVGLGAVVAGVLVEGSELNQLGTVAHSSNAGAADQASTTTTSPSGASSTSPYATSSAQTASTVTVDECPSTYGITGLHPVPARLAAAAAASNGLVFYANTALAVLAPKGWRCSGAVGADGSGQIAVVSGDGSEQVTASEGSACVSCNAALACPLITAAANALPAGVSCPSHPPPAEEVSKIGSTTVAFEDPPYVRGTGIPSGGADPANGVLLYAGQPPEAYKETCTLAAYAHSVCSTILNDFLSRYPGSP